MRALRVGLAQINTTVGDLAGKVAKILEDDGPGGSGPGSLTRNQR